MFLLQLLISDFIQAFVLVRRIFVVNREWSHMKKPSKFSPKEQVSLSNGDLLFSIILSCSNYSSFRITLNRCSPYKENCAMK